MKHVFLVAPSSSIAKEEIIATQNHFESLGRKVTVSPDLLGDDLLCANTDEQRFKHLKEALTSDADEIVCIVGGYGLTPLMPKLMDLPKPDKVKILYGFSDVTALHIFLNQVWDWPSVHSPCGLQLARQDVDKETMRRSGKIFDEGLSAYILPDLIPLNSVAQGIENMCGKVAGGNLSLVQTSLGTPWQLRTSDKILFLEDVNERGYRIDRILVHLQQAGLFKGVKSVIFGDFTKGDESDGSNLVGDVLQRFAETMPFPVFRLPGCGHGPQNYPIPFNFDVSFKVA